MGSVREWDVEGFWMCPACGSRCPGITGAERESLRCVNCGREKEPEDPWIAPEEEGPENALTGRAAELADAGANVTCGHCGVECRFGAVSCDECGAPLTEERPAAPAPEPEPVVGAAETAPRPVEERPPPSPEPARPAPRTYASPEPLDLGRPFPWKTVAAALVAVAALLTFIRWVGAEREVAVEVVALEWSRSIRADQRVVRAGAGWIDSARASREVVGVGECETRPRGTRPCDPYPCRCRPDISCNCTGGEQYSCPPCVGGGTRECNCRPTGAYDCRCTRTRTNRRNGSFRIRESCDTCYRGRSCERCSVPRVCRTCTTPRVCQRCPRDLCDTCYRTCPVFGQWCAYTFAEWEPLPVARASAAGHSAVWPRVTLPVGVPTRTTREEHYWVTYRSTEAPFETWRQEVDANTYGRTDYQTRYQAAVTRLNRITLLHPLH